MARTTRTLAEKHTEKPEEGSKRKRSRAEYVVRADVGDIKGAELIRLRSKDDVTAFLKYLEEYAQTDDPTNIVIQIGKVWSLETFMNGQE